MSFDKLAHVSLQTRLTVGDCVGGLSVLRVGGLRHRRRDLHGFERAHCQVDDEADAGLPEGPHEAQRRPHVCGRRSDAGERWLAPCSTVGVTVVADPYRARGGGWLRVVHTILATVAADPFGAEKCATVRARSN